MQVPKAGYRFEFRNSHHLPTPASYPSFHEFVAPLILITDDEKFTLPVALFNLQSGSLGSVDYGALLSGVVAAALPCIAVFLILQRYYVRGFLRGALKG